MEFDFPLVTYMHDAREWLRANQGGIVVSNQCQLFETKAAEGRVRGNIVSRAGASEDALSSACLVEDDGLDSGSDRRDRFSSRTASSS